MPAIVRLFVCVLLATCATAQDSATVPLAISTKELPPASLWKAYGIEHRYGFELQSDGGVGPRHWRIVSGSLPNGMKLDESSGIISGSPDETGEFEFTVLLRDNTQSVKRNFFLIVEPPLTVNWDRKAEVNGQRIDGAVKVSNQTGRDFDLTYIVLAVNDIGRATAIGYQHFPLKQNTRDLQLPFGDALSPGTYAIHVDVVGEEPISKRIFRARLASANQNIAPSP